MISSGTGPDIIVEIANKIDRIDYDYLRRLGAVDQVKLNILDTLGVTLAASTLMEGCRGLAELALEAGGKPESTLLAFGGKVPCWSAAFVNGGMVHCLDYDDVHDPTALHPSSPTIPAAIAMAERVGGINGKEFISAVVLGGDLVCKLGLALEPRWRNRVRDWMLTQVLGVFGAAAAAGKLAKLSREQMADALGIAFIHAGGTNELLAPGSTVRGFYSHVPALAGVLSVMMSQKGITGIKNPLEGKFGLFNMYFGGEYDRQPLADFGEGFDFPNKVGIKAWAACRQCHTYIEATIKIVGENNIPPADIKVITVGVGEQAKRLCEPAETRQKPATIMDAKFSIPWCVACAAARKEVTLRDFTAEGLKDAEALKLACRVVPRFDPEVNILVGVPPGKVEIETLDGRKFSSTVKHSYGNPENPMTVDQAVIKFRECVSFSAEKLDKGREDEIIESVLNLEKAEDVREVFGLLAG